MGNTPREPKTGPVFHPMPRRYAPRPVQQDETILFRERTRVPALRVSIIIATIPHSEMVASSVRIALMLEASYICDSCGEEIVIPIDQSAGTAQEYVEDCPVCCRANLIYVEFKGGNANVRSEAE